MRGRRVRMDRRASERWDVPGSDLPNGSDDPPVSGTPAEVPGQSDPDLLLGGIWVVTKQRGRGHQHARGAEAALHARLLQERPLERSDLLVPGEPLDRRDLATHRLQGEVRARVHRFAVEEHHARAALGVVASFLGAGEAELLAHRRQEADVRIQLDRIVGAVHAERCSDLHRPAPQLAPCSAGLAGIGTSPPRARVRAAVIARFAITAAIAPRYSAEPRTSLIGVEAAAAAAAAASTA